LTAAKVVAYFASDNCGRPLAAVSKVKIRQVGLWLT
jgi:hypothetical protein